MGKTFKRGSKNDRFDDGFYGVSQKEIERKKEKDLKRKEKAQEKRFIEDEE